jgi:3-hydroxybutyryl-CoA dehydrogenase
VRVSILGSGKLGKDIALLLSQSTKIHIIDLIVTKSSFNKKKILISNFIKSSSEKLKKKYQVDFFKKINITDSYSSIKGTDFIIESVVEDIHIKKEIISIVNKYTNNHTLFFSNTSSISISRLSKIYKFPNQFFGMHFFNPVIRTKLVELAFINEEYKEKLEPIISLLEGLSRRVVVLKDYPGHIVNRILLAQINEALSILENEIATPKEVDEGFKLATNSLMGPFELADLIGNDIVFQMFKNLYEETKKETFQPNNILRSMVKEDKLGVKTKIGFFTYE